MNCNDMNLKLADLLFEPETENAVAASSPKGEAELHLAACGECRRQLEELRATMSLMDTWEAPEPNPYFLTRLNARLEGERQAAPASWFERVKSRLMYGSHVTLRPVAAMALTVVMLVGGGTYLGFNNWDQPAAPPAQAAVVHDLQTLDNNTQLLDQLESMSDQPDAPDQSDQSDPIAN